MRSPSGSRRWSSLRMLEIAAVALLAIATVASAWCAYQAAQWNGESTRIARTSAEARIDASRQFALATQQIAYDADFVRTYAAAIATDNPELARFYRDTLAREEFLPIVDRWEAQVAAGETPMPLLEDEAYLAAQFATYDEAIALAESTALESEEANQNSAEYVLGALMVAVSLFFAGVTTSFQLRTVRFALLSSSALVLAFAASRVAELPVL